MHTMHGLGLTPPHPLPAERCKGQPRKGVGEDWSRQPYCHTLLGLNVCSPEGEMLSVFFTLCFFVSGPVSFVVFCRSSPLRVVFWKNFRERTFVGCWCRFCVFWWFFAYVFALFCRASLPKVFGKILLMSGLVCFFLLRDKDQVVTGRPRTRTCFSGLFFLCPAAFACFARFGHASRFLAFFRGAILGPGRFWDSPGTCSEAPFLGTRGGRGVPCFLCLVFSFPLLFCFAATLFLDARVGSLTEVG